MALTSQTITVYTVVVFSIVRFMTICQPLRSQQYQTRRQMRLLVGAIFVYSVVFNIPRALEHFSIVMNTCNCSNISASHSILNCTYYWTRLGDNDLYKSVYQSYGYTFGIFVIPVTLVSVLNARLAVLLHGSRFILGEDKNTKTPLMEQCSVTVSRLIVQENCDPTEPSSAASDENERTSNLMSRTIAQNPYFRPRPPRSCSRYDRRNARITARLFCLVSVFIVFQSFPMVDNLLITFLQDEWKATMTYYNVFYAMCQFSVMMNSSLNTVLYCFLGQRFRRTFFVMLQRRSNCICSFLRLCKFHQLSSLFNKV